MILSRAPPKARVAIGRGGRSPVPLGLVWSVALLPKSRGMRVQVWDSTGLGWSVFTHIVARGRNVVFAQDTPVRIRLINTPT